MKTVLAVLILLIITLGLIAGPVSQQVAGIREAGESGEMEMTRVSMVTISSDYVTGNVVKYLDKLYLVSVKDELGNSLSVANVVDKAVFRKNVLYNASGEIILIEFDQIDLKE